MGNSSHNLHEILAVPKVRETFCCLCPSFPVRLRRSAKSFNDVFSDEVLAEQFPKSFDALGLYDCNPFTSCQIGDVESTWMMLLHGLDLGIVDHVCRLLSSHVYYSRPENRFYKQR